MRDENEGMCVPGGEVRDTPDHWLFKVPLNVKLPRVELLRSKLKLTMKRNKMENFGA